MGFMLKNIVNSPFKGLNYSNISSDFGNRTFTMNGKKVSDFHEGVDMTSGSEVVAVAPGIVISVKTNVTGFSQSNSAGNYVFIDHGQNIHTCYFHLKYGSLKVKKGDKVSKGQLLALKGSTGYSTAEHLHFGVRINGKYVDPKPYLIGTKNFPGNNNNKEQNTSQQKNKFKIGDEVIISGNLYSSSNAIKPSGAIKYKKTKITRIVDAAHPYNTTGDIGWMDEKSITFVTQSATQKYVVKNGDTLSKIAIKYKTTWQKIYADNKAKIGDNPNKIKVGIELIIKK